MGDELNPATLRAQNRKFTNRVGGLQIEIESRSNVFDTFSWVTEAAHVESGRFCRPISFRAVNKTVSLLPILVVHALLSPCMQPYLQSRWPLLQLASVLYRNPMRRAFPSKRLLLLHVLELARPKRHVQLCPPVCIGYQEETLVSLSKAKSSITSSLRLSKPLALLEDSLVLSPIQRRVLLALLPIFCVPYAQSALHGHDRKQVMALLLAWGKVAIASLHLQHVFPPCTIAHSQAKEHGSSEMM